MLRTEIDTPRESWPDRRARLARDMQQRMVAHLAAGSTDMAAGPMSNDPRVYLDPVRFAAEKRELLGKLPMLAGLSGDLPNPGDKLLFEATGVPVLIVRGRDGRIRAFLNMCTHRAAKLVETCDARKLMTCRFHGWTFDLEGRLAGLPGPEAFEGVDRATRGLIEVPSREWAGMIFIKTDPQGPQIDLPAFLGDFAPELEQLEFAKAIPVKRGRIDVRTNWKYALDTYGEGYHFATLHPSTIGDQVTSNVMIYDTFGPHHRCGFPRKDLTDLVGTPPESWPAPTYGGIHLLFPNSALNISPMPDGGYYYALQRMFPGDTPGEAFTLIWSYRVGGDPAEDNSRWEAQHDFIMHVVSTEDYSVSEGGWRNLKTAPPGFRVLYGANEISLQHLHQAIAGAIGMPLP